jgi:hypothetical protein
MIFACGVRYMRLRSAALSGRASLSPRVAVSVALGVIDLSVLSEIGALLNFSSLRDTSSRVNCAEEGSRFETRAPRFIDLQ